MSHLQEMDLVTQAKNLSPRLSQLPCCRHARWLSPNVFAAYLRHPIVRPSQGNLTGFPSFLKMQTPTTQHKHATPRISRNDVPPHRKRTTNHVPSAVGSHRITLTSTDLGPEMMLEKVYLWRNLHRSLTIRLAISSPKSEDHSSFSSTS